MRILFIDWAHSGAAYDERTLEEQSLGGSEATLLRIAGALAATHEVYVAQTRRATDYHGSGPRYVGPATLEALSRKDDIDICIVQRKHKAVPRVAGMFPSARLVLWVHDYLALKSRFARHRLARAKCRMVAVTQTHAGHTAAVFGNGWRKAYPQRDGAGPAEWPVTSIPNPVADDLEPDGTPVDVNKLVFFSSPHKGLRQVLERFADVRRRFPSCRLYLANPGYRTLTDRRYSPVDALHADGVEVLGSLSHDKVIDQLRGALCVFYPQTVFPETFGLVYAEANAVGTPVLAHDFGSAAELLSAEQLVDGNSTRAIVARIGAWRAERPTVRLDPRFRLAAVVAVWNHFLRRVADREQA